LLGRLGWVVPKPARGVDGQKPRTYSIRNLKDLKKFRKDYGAKPNASRFQLFLALYAKSEAVQFRKTNGSAVRKRAEFIIRRRGLEGCATVPEDDPRWVRHVLREQDLHLDCVEAGLSRSIVLRAVRVLEFLFSTTARDSSNSLSEGSS
jgi:hypothetical protein